MSNISNCPEKQNSCLTTDKSAKYDRQLRLWGNHGQTKLESSRVCLINASTVGTETLKSIVLPGVGYFTIIDDNFVTEEDVANNFFLTNDSIGENRAKIASSYLCELNPDVIGDFLGESIDLILMNRPEYLKTFNLVIASNLNESTVKKLSEYLWVENVPFMILRSYGFIGYMRIISNEHKIIQAHPDNVIPDLRLDKPFEELVHYCNGIDLDSLKDTEHSHIPYLVILLKYLEIWKSQHNNQIPRVYKEKEQFKNLIREGIRKTEDDVPKFEENFEEAIKNINNSITNTQIPAEIVQLFEDEKCLNLNSSVYFSHCFLLLNYSVNIKLYIYKSDFFWIILRAIREFTHNEGLGQLPLRGSIPDMVSDSERFVSLQNVYRAKAQHDIEAVMTRVERLLLNINKPYDFINEQQVKLFCKNAYFLKVIKYRSLAQEYDPQTSNIENLMERASDSDEDLIFYLLIRSLELFHSEYNRYPGANHEILESDVSLLKRILNKFLIEHRVNNMSIKEEFIYEICRYGNTELHSISGFLGGCAAHESIKLLTNQFIPINNTLIYNGIKQSTSVYEI